MKRPVFDHYFVYEEITSLLRDFEREYPGLISVSSICHTPDDHEIWCASITDSSTGPCETKPAFYIDANQHAGEVTGSMAALHFITTLLTGFGTDERITELLKTSSFYIIPRVAMDGSEVYLTTENTLRSANRMYPYKDAEPGLHGMDMDGDGVIRQMRIKTPHGKWKVSNKDPRIMIKRLPSDMGGTYYDIYTEGDIVGDYDGFNIKVARPKWSMDFNRNFPFGWSVEGNQRGAGDYPLCNPETKALADFVVAHPNICNSLTFHTSGGVFLSVPSTVPPKDANRQDMKMFEAIGAMATEETGYPCVNCYESTVGGVGIVMSGAFDDWMYQSLGIPCYTVEFWDLEARAGIKNTFKAADNNKTEEQIHEEQCMIYRYLDSHIPGEWFRPWEEFDHPTLGKVEIGGANRKFVIQNPPPHMLEEVIEGHSRFCIRDAMTMPRLSVDMLKAEKTGGLWKITAAVSNLGYLPTFVTSEALKLKADKPLKAFLTFDGSIVSGSAEENIGHLCGFGDITAPGATPVKLVSWVIDAPEGSEITFTVSSEKCGTVSKTVTLK